MMDIGPARYSPAICCISAVPKENRSSQCSIDGSVLKYLSNGDGKSVHSCVGDMSGQDTIAIKKHAAAMIFALKNRHMGIRRLMQNKKLYRTWVKVDVRIVSNPPCVQDNGIQRVAVVQSGRNVDHSKNFVLAGT
jgi:hypothetical protein